MACFVRSWDNYTCQQWLGAPGDATFATLVTALLKEARPLAAPLAKREFTADDLAETT